jgi:hypothetical protein
VGILETQMSSEETITHMRSKDEVKYLSHDSGNITIPNVVRRDDMLHVIFKARKTKTEIHLSIVGILELQMLSEERTSRM